MAAAEEWMHAIDSPLPRALRVGAGTAMFVSGWVFHRRMPVQAVTLRLGNVDHPVPTHSMPRLDVYVARAQPGDRPATASYRSGFWAVLPVPGVTTAVEAALELHAASDEGERFSAELATIRLLPSPVPPAEATEPGLVAICMTTYNPDLDLFRRQVASIRDQTHENWCCVVSDDLSEPETYAGIEAVLAGDSRFELHRNPERLGVYFNFERALDRAPPEAEAVALCDQDDEWQPGKLATLLGALRQGHSLVYSDQRIVTPLGEVLAPSYWGRRENQWTDLRTLVVANTVTGAASLFRRDLLDVALPFPPRLAGAYHDHWLALAALASRGIDYVDEPLYDYVQHEGQVVGHAAAKGGTLEATPPAPRLTRGHELLLRWQFAYFADLVPPQFAATALLERCGPRLRSEDRVMLASLADGDSTLRGMLAHGRTSSALRSKNDGDAFGAFAGMAWRRWSRWRTRGDAAPFADGRHSLDARPSYAEYGPEDWEQAAGSDQKGSTPGRGRRRWRAR